MIGFYKFSHCYALWAILTNQLDLPIFDRMKNLQTVKRKLSQDKFAPCILEKAQFSDLFSPSNIVSFPMLSSLINHILLGFSSFGGPLWTYVPENLHFFVSCSFSVAYSYRFSKKFRKIIPLFMCCFHLNH